MKSFILSISILAFTACSLNQTLPEGDPALHYPSEVRLQNIRQLTRGGTNAEAYWSFDGQWLSDQHRGLGSESPGCDQIYRLSIDGKVQQMVSNGKGRTTCSFYFPDNSRILYSSTFASDAACPAPPDMSRGYVWPIYPTFQMYSAKPDGSDTLPLEPGAPKAYNAEATVCKDGSVVFTSDRDGDLDLYTAKLDPMGTLKDIKRITFGLGYDGGAFFSNDCKKLVWRASRPRPGKETEEYNDLLKQHLVKPTQLEIWTGNADGTHAHQVTRMGSASFAPFFTPDGKSIIFASNPRDAHGRGFDLYLINTDGTGLERVTYSNTFESFPMFSPDGKHLAFSSNRNNKAPHETNVFLADWVPKPEGVRRPEPLSSQADPADRFAAIVGRLSAPDTEGRGPGTPGLAIAENYVEHQFKAIGLKPFSEVFKSATEGYRQSVSIRLGKENVVRANNLIGTWGKGCGSKPPVLVGAHLDHLGYGSENSLEIGKHVIHPGADDNASGVAGVLETARIMTRNPKALEGCTIFAAFTGEEVGVVGSSRLAELLKTSHIKLKAMINLDMIGRLENNKLILFGSDSAREWHGMIDTACAEHRITCGGGGDGYGPSDHMSFYIAKVPVLHAFTGPHSDYHRASDTADKVNATGGVQVAEVIADLALQVESPRQKLTYVRPKSTPQMGVIGSKRSKGAYLGTIPDYGSLSSPNGFGSGSIEGGGVPLSGTRPGSPAEQAGVKEGDILFEIDTLDSAGLTPAVIHRIADLNGFMQVLTDLAPGQRVNLGIRRQQTTLKLPATVGKHE